MPTALWTFSSFTTTGFEGDTDVNLGLVMQPLGDGGAPPGVQPVPCPTVPGVSGNGRLLSSAGKYNEFATDKETALAYTSGQPMSLTFKWRPLLEYAFGPPYYSMGGFVVRGYNSAGNIGLLAVAVTFNNTTTPGVYDLQVSTLDNVSYTSVGTFAMSLRDWHDFEMTYDGAGTFTFSIDGGVIGTCAYSPASSDKTVIGFVASNGGFFRALSAVLDTVSFTV